MNHFNHLQCFWKASTNDAVLPIGASDQTMLVFAVLEGNDKTFSLEDLLMTVWGKTPWPTISILMFAWQFTRWCSHCSEHDHHHNAIATDSCMTQGVQGKFKAKLITYSVDVLRERTGNWGERKPPNNIIHRGLWFTILPTMTPSSWQALFINPF